MSCPDFLGPSRRSGAVDTPKHFFDLTCCSVPRRHVGQNLKPHFWHWKCPLCDLDTDESDVHFGHGLSSFLICGVME